MRFAGPKWLLGDKVLRGTVGATAYAGWISLHVAVVRGDGAGKATGHAWLPKVLKIKESHYLYRTCNIPARLGIVHPKDSNYGIQFAREIGECVARYIPESIRISNWNKERVWFFFEFADGEVKEMGLMEGFDISTPFTALKSAYEVLVRLRDTAQCLEGIEIVALIWFGLASAALLNMRRCALCFRWAMPGHRFCGEHSQSGESADPIEVKRLRYLHGVRVSNSPFYRPSRSPKTLAIKADRLPRIISRVLWGTPLPDEDRTAESIRNALRLNPEVGLLLGGDCATLRNTALYGRLNDRLDRYEFDPSAWAGKISSLAEWMRAEAKALPGRRGRGETNQQRIRMAVSLAANGAKQSHIAARLGIRSSAISNWIKRGQAPDLQRLFAMQRLNKEQRY